MMTASRPSDHRPTPTLLRASTMKFLKRDVLRPGTYVKDGKLVTVTRDDVRQRLMSLVGLRQVGLHVPLLMEHTDPRRKAGEGLPGQFNGAAFQYGEAAADELKRTVGAVDLSDPRSGINAQGGLDLVFDVPDAPTAKKLHDQRIRFVSPELRPEWIDGKGNRHTNVMTHVALTHKPIQIDQAAGFEQVALSSLNAPCQLSCTDMESNFAISVNDLDVCQFDGTFDDDNVDEDPERTPPNAPPPPEPNPNLPKEKNSDEQMMEAINAHLMKLGIRLPEDTTPEEFMRSLLTALMTKVASDDKAAADSATGQGGDDDPDDVEEKMPLTKQFSSDSNHGKLLARINRARKANVLPAGMGDQMLIQLSSTQFDAAGNEVVNGGFGITGLLTMYEQQATQFADGSPQATLMGEIDQAAAQGVLTPGEADQLRGKVGSVQFSDSGAEKTPAGGFGIRQFIQMSRQRGNVMKGLLTDQTIGATATQFSDSGHLTGGPIAQFSGGMEAAHPGGDAFVTGSDEVSPEQAKQLAAAMLERTGMARRKKKTGESMLDVMNAQMSGAQ